MGAPFQPHVTLFPAYPFPIIREHVDRKLPKALLNIPPPFRDPLVAVLTSDLSHDAAKIFIPAQRTAPLTERESSLYLRFGGHQFYTLQQTHERLLAKRQEVIERQRELDAIIPRYSDSTFARAANTRFGRDLSGGFVRWRYDGFPKSEVERVQERVSRSRRNLATVNLKLAEIETALDRFKVKLRDSVFFVKEWEATCEKPLNIVAHERALTAFDGVVANLLRNTDPAWWAPFSLEYFNRVEVDSREAPQRILFRGSALVSAITAETDGDKWDKAAASHLMQHHQRLGTNIKIAPKTVAGWRKECRDEDFAEIKWLTDRKYGVNFYTRWLKRLLERPKIGPWPHINLDTDLLGAHGASFANHEFEEHLWDYNKLVWVLTPAAVRKRRFDPPFLPHGLENQWAVEFQRWREEVEAEAANRLKGWRISSDGHPSGSCSLATTGASSAEWSPSLSLWPVRLL